ncbi:CP4-6 prophage; putative phage integrase [Paraburkholderia sacchari]|uniref:tyrosine-type recombinase/integrase n=1 Tax=Paraburkholderia sacchari TaxID=159450 RepID=UPI0039A5E118
MAKVSFTAARVEAHRCPDNKSQSFLWDAKAPGLGLRATPGGAKTYIFQAKVHGAAVRVPIGDPRSWPIEKAREKAHELRILVDGGIDPREHAAQQRAAHEARKAEARRQGATVSDAWAVYLAARKAKWSERHYQDHLRLSEAGGREVKRGKGQIVAGPLATLMGLRLSELTRERVDTWLETEAEMRPARARLAFSLLRAFVTWCNGRPEYAGLASLEICSNRQIREHLPKPHVKNDCLEREMLPAWFAAVSKIGNPVIAAYLQALLITGARREEMAALKWADVDFQWRSLSIADKVEEAGRIIPLTHYLASLLGALPRRNEWVFSSPTAGDGKIAEPRIAHNQALTAAGLPHVSLHGLRRSFGTLAEWVEVPVGVVAQIQGHKPSAIAEKHYRRRPLDLLRKWHDNIEAWMLEQAGIQFDSHAVQPGLRAVQ